MFCRMVNYMCCPKEAIEMGNTVRPITKKVENNIAGNWYSGKKVVCSTNRIKTIEWENSAVYVDQTANDLKNSPEFDFHNPINQETERNLYNYYQTERNKI